MANPMHTNPTKAIVTKGAVPKSRPRREKDTPVWARAPYNFVPLAEQVISVDVNTLPNLDSFDGYTGTIDCVLVTQSPVYVRGLMTPDDFTATGQKSFDELSTDQAKRRAQFYSVEGTTPRLPGSSLRGMIRALVEIITFSKMDWVTNEPLVYRAVADDAESPLGKTYRDQLRRDHIRAGYIARKDHEWCIRPALPIEGHPFATTRATCPPGGDWHAIANARQIRAGSGAWVGTGNTREWRIDTLSGVSGQGQPVLFVSVDQAPNAREGEKNQYLFGLPNDKADPVPIPDEVVRRYREQVSQQQKKFLGNKAAALREHQPVFYLVDDRGHIVFFGHARYFRLPYERSPHDLVPEQLRKAHTVDLADAIFGYVGKGDKGQLARAGRVSFGDAQLVAGQGDVWLPFAERGKDWFTPRVLSEPKPTTFQHYLVQDKDLGHDPDCKLWLAHYGSGSDTTIRGSKLYWHKSGTVGAEQLAFAGDQDKFKRQLTGIRPLKAGVKFQMRVRFENLNAQELGALLWAIDLPPGHSHSLGMGKPLGMGAVHLNEVRLNLSDRRARYSTLFGPSGWAQPMLADATDFKARFEALMRSELGLGSEPFANHERIRALLRLLSYPGPDNAWTRYMEIDHSDGDYRTNEYKNRPVLPDPMHVIADRDCAGHRPTEQCRELTRGAQPRQTEPKRQADRGRTSVTQPTIPNVQPKVTPEPAQAIEPVQTDIEGEIIEIRPDKRTGKVRARKDGKVYSFSTAVIRGDFPANRSLVEFDVRAGRVTRLRRR